MYELHPSFTPPQDLDVPIWRYMSFSQYVSLLEHRALWFSRVDRMEDRFEGAYTNANIRNRAELGDPLAIERPSLSTEQVADAMVPVGTPTTIADLTRTMLRCMVVSCWHMNEVESVAMWSLYAAKGQGVAVRSTFRRLTECFIDDESVFAGVMNYVDYDDFMIPEGNVFGPFVHKRRSFEHEKELRALRWGVARLDGQPLLTDSNPYPEGGEAVAVDLHHLIERVYVAPSAEVWLRDVIAAVTDRYGLKIDVHQSSLDADPLY